MLKVAEISAASILTPQKVGSLSGAYDFSLNPYAGCAFACSYCYVPKFPNGRHESFEWGGWVEVKINAPDLIRRARAEIFGARIFFSSATDPYQYLELKYRLTRRCLLELLRYEPAHLTMHTRSHLIFQDIELLKRFGGRLSVGVSLTTDDEEVRREFEPKAPSIARRLQLIRRLAEEGIDVYVSMAPLLPCHPRRLVSLVVPYVERIWIDNMRWTEINANPRLLEKYSAHFAYDRHAALVDEVFGFFFAERKRLGPDGLVQGEGRRRRCDRFQAQTPSKGNERLALSGEAKQLQLPIFPGQSGTSASVCGADSGLL